jgi:hypothetical protein
MKKAFCAAIILFTLSAAVAYGQTAQNALDRNCDSHHFCQVSSERELRYM